MVMADLAKYILGIDLGSNSLGWAALSCEGERPAGILASGVRVFAAGAAGLDRGRDESNAAARRVARLQRRQTDRRRRRIGKIYNMIAAFGMLPPAKSAEGRMHALTELDQTLVRSSGPTRSSRTSCVRSPSTSHLNPSRRGGRSFIWRNAEGSFQTENPGRSPTTSAAR